MTHKLWQWGINVAGAVRTSKTPVLTGLGSGMDIMEGREGSISVAFTKRASLVCSVTNRDVRTNQS